MGRSPFSKHPQRGLCSQGELMFSIDEGDVGEGRGEAEVSLSASSSMSQLRRSSGTPERTQNPKGGLFLLINLICMNLF